MKVCVISLSAKVTGPDKILLQLVASIYNFKQMLKFH